MVVTHEFRSSLEAAGAECGNCGEDLKAVREDESYRYYAHECPKDPANQPHCKPTDHDFVESTAHYRLVYCRKCAVTRDLDLRNGY